MSISEALIFCVKKFFLAFLCFLQKHFRSTEGRLSVFG